MAFPATKRERDLRLDLIRGLALFIIFVDHNASLSGFGWITAFTLGRYSFIDAADVFFFLSGFVSGLVYGPIISNRGVIACVKKASRRCLELYLCEVATLVICFGLITAASRHSVGMLIPYLRFVVHGVRPGTIMYLAWWRPPIFFGILPIYILLLLTLPLSLYLLVHRPRVLIALSLCCYLLAQFLPSLQSYYNADGTGFDGFDPLAWQVVSLWIGVGIWEIRDPFFAEEPQSSNVVYGYGGTFVDRFRPNRSVRTDCGNDPQPGAYWHGSVANAVYK